jgi:hypothetical protein
MILGRGGGEAGERQWGDQQVWLRAWRSVLRGLVSVEARQAGATEAQHRLHPIQSDNTDEHGPCQPSSKAQGQLRGFCICPRSSDVIFRKLFSICLVCTVSIIPLSLAKSAVRLTPLSKYSIYPLMKSSYHDDVFWGFYENSIFPTSKCLLMLKSIKKVEMKGYLKNTGDIVFIADKYSKVYMDYSQYNIIYSDFIDARSREYIENYVSNKLVVSKYRSARNREFRKIKLYGWLSGPQKCIEVYSGLPVIFIGHIEG